MRAWSLSEAFVVRVTGVRARERNVMLSTILIIILILLLIGALPTWPYSCPAGVTILAAPSASS